MEMYTRQETGSEIQTDPKAKDLLRGAFEKNGTVATRFPGISS